MSELLVDYRGRFAPTCPKCYAWMTMMNPRRKGNTRTRNTVQFRMGDTVDA